MIEVAGLRKEFGEVTAVAGVSFTAQAGEIFGLLGPNGAGKTTTISCISGLIAPTAGHVRVMGHDVVSAGTAARRALGVVPQEIALYDDLSATDNLAYWGGAQRLRGAELKRRIGEVLEVVGLQDRARDAVKNYSGGSVGGSGGRRSFGRTSPGRRHAEGNPLSKKLIGGAAVMRAALIRQDPDP